MRSLRKKIAPIPPRSGDVQGARVAQASIIINRSVCPATLSASQIVGHTHWVEHHIRPSSFATCESDRPSLARHYILIGYSSSETTPNLQDNSLHNRGTRSELKNLNPLNCYKVSLSKSSDSSINTEDPSVSKNIFSSYVNCVAHLPKPILNRMRGEAPRAGESVRPSSTSIEMSMFPAMHLNLILGQKP